MNNEIIVVKQLPIIVEQLQTIKTDVSQRTKKALSLVCTEDTLATVKKERANLNKEFDEWERKRKEVKKAVLSPYEQFEEVYKDCITDIFSKADAELKKKIDSVENELKENKKAEVKSYFDELCISESIDFVTFDKAGINITKTASLKSLKEKANTFVKRIRDDLNLIDTQEHKDEILYEYKQSLNVSSAITTVTNRYKAIEAEQARKEAEKEKQEAVLYAGAKVEKVLKDTPLSPPAEVTPPETSADNEPVFRTTFTITATKSKLIALREFLSNGGYNYECK